MIRRIWLTDFGGLHSISIRTPKDLGNRIQVEEMEWQDKDHAKMNLDDAMKQGFTEMHIGLGLFDDDDLRMIRDKINEVIGG